MQISNKNMMNYMMPLKITLPVDDSTVDKIVEIRGTGQPFSYIFVQIDEMPFLVTSVDVNGLWLVECTLDITDGEHTIIATQNQYYQYETDSIKVKILNR